MSDFNINIAVAGSLCDDGGNDISIKIVKAFTSITNAADQVLLPKKTVVNIFTPKNDSVNWKNVLKDRGLNFFECPYSLNSDGEKCDMVTWMCDKADVILLTWDEKFNGSVERDLLQMSKQNRTPCVWVSKASNQNNDVYLSINSYYDIFSVQSFSKYVKSLICERSENEGPEQKIPLIKLGEILFKRFDKKYKAMAQKISYEKNIPAEDSLHTDEKKETDTVKENSHEVKNSENIAVGDKISEEKRIKEYREKMSVLFSGYDDKANMYGDKFKYAMYLRSILPFIASIVLAIGFYIETIFGRLSFNPLNEKIWTAVAGIGFFLHAGVNFYSYLLSKNEQLKRWQKEFVYNRNMAELMRLLIHFIPYGLSINVKRVLEKCGGTSDHNHEIYTNVRDFLCDNSYTDIPFSDKNSRNALNSLHDMVEDQKNYQQGCVSRYGSIIEKYGKRREIAFRTGFVFIIIRGIIQLALCFLGNEKARELINLSFATDSVAYIKSFLNMIALLTPAVASYFSSKIVMNGYEELHKESKKMIDKLNDIEKIIEQALARDNLSFELMHNISEDICTRFFNDRVEWNLLMMSRKFTLI